MLSEPELEACIEITSLPKLAGWDEEGEGHGCFVLKANSEYIYSKTAFVMGYDFIANMVLVISLG